MYSRNKQRKEQQLMNLRQLTAKTANINSTADGGERRPPNRSPSDSMANRWPLQATASSPNQSSKSSLVSRNQCRTPKRDNSSTVDCRSSPSSKSETSPNSMLRSVNRSPTTRSPTSRTDSRTAGLQSRTTALSPNGKREASLPQSLCRSSANTHSKQSLSQIGKTTDHPIEVNQRTVTSANDQQNQQKSMSSTLTSTSTTTESTISPEILFLVKQQAKAIAQINALQKKVEQLEQLINCQKSSGFNDNPTLVMPSASGSTTKNLVTNCSNTSKERIAISDDSGGEYSRATTASEDDELSLLLDEIARRSLKLQSSQQISNRFTNLSISSSISGTNPELLPQTMQTMQFQSKKRFNIF